MNIYQILDLANATIAEYGLYGWKAELDNGKKRAGACHYSRRVLSFSQHILPNASDEDVLETIRHEVAHAIVGHSAGHGPAFKRQLIEMGGTGRRTHSMATPELRWKATCPTHGAIGTRRTRPQGQHTHRRCGQVITWTDSVTGAKVGGGEPVRNWKLDLPIIDVRIAADGTRTEVHTPARTAPKPRPASAVKSRPCTCKCGGSTKGGMYLPGHDARHVAELFDLVNRKADDPQWLNAEYAFQKLPTAALRDKLAKRLAARTS
jgi:predicted SprT family Zn-dependent metalloprotease